MSGLLRWIKGVWRFIVDFFVGDTPELFHATVGILVLIWFISRVCRLHTLAAVLLVAGVLIALTISLVRAAKRVR